MSFDVMREPWIDCVALDGSMVTLGIRELLLRAHELRAVRDISPLQEYGIYRLLCVIAMDMLKPRGIGDMEELLGEGRFDEKTVDSYIAFCEKDGPCFDLFDAQRPFMQDRFDERYDDKKNVKPVTTMLHDVPSGNNHVHFYHTAADRCELSDAECAKALCAVNIFCTSGLQGPSSVNGAPPIYAIISDTVLYRIIIMNCISKAANTVPEYDEPGPCYRWNHTYKPGEKVAKVSLLEGMTFKPRRICLIDNGNAVREMYFQKGADFEGYSSWRDPHTVITDKKSSVKPSLDKDTWRNLPMIFSDSGPLTVKQAAGIGEEMSSISVTVYGLVTRQAAMDIWMRDEAAMPKAIVNCGWRLDELRGYVALAEKTAEVLRKSLRLIENTTEIKQPSIIRQTVQGFYSEARSWLMADGINGIAYCEYDELEAMRKGWKGMLKGRAREAFAWGSMQMGDSAEILKASAMAEIALNKGLNKELEISNKRGKEQ